MKIEDKQTVINVLRMAAKDYSVLSATQFAVGCKPMGEQWADKAADCIGAIAIMEESK